MFAFIVWLVWLALKIAKGLSTGAWAPDSFHLTFHSILGGGSEGEAYIVGSDGSSLRQLPMTVRPISSAWSPDQKSVYVSAGENSTTASIWKWNLDGLNAEKFVDDCCLVMVSDPAGKYLLGPLTWGEKVGIYEVSIPERKCIQLRPCVLAENVVFARDGKSFLYPVASRGEVTIFRQPWKEGKLIRAPQVALKVPFAFPLLDDFGNAYDFSADLSTIVYVRFSGHADFSLLSQK